MTGEPIRVAIVDDHPALRDGTAVLLQREDDIEVVACLDSLATTRELLGGDRPPDVLVLDIRLGDERGLDMLAEVAGQTDGRTAVVVWTGFDLPQYASFALQTGAAGFVVKTAPLSDLIGAIRAAAAGGMHFTRAATQKGGLSERESDVVAKLVAGQSNDEIAATLGVTTRAVEAHLTRLYRRFDVASRTELATMTMREGWLDVPHHQSRTS